MTINSRPSLLVFLALPLLAVATLMAYRHYQFHSGIEVTFPIRGYDPRDLLSGYYLVYEIDYGAPNPCKKTKHADVKEAFLCLDRNQFFWTKPKDCSKLITGKCIKREFRAGVEKFFVPENDALVLEKIIAKKQASIVLLVNQMGRALVKDLLIEGLSWKQAVSLYRKNSDPSSKTSTP